MVGTRSSNLWNGKETICAVLRELHERATELAKEIPGEGVFVYVSETHSLLAKATQMAKRMDTKLREYKADWDRHEWKEIGNE